MILLFPSSKAFLASLTIPVALATCSRHPYALAQTALECVINGGKVLTCGSAAAAALAQYAAALLMGGLARERSALPALVLGAEAATFAALAQRSEGVGALAAQVHALGQPGDALMVFAHPASSDHASLALAVQAAHEREMPVIAITGEGEAELLSRYRYLPNLNPATIHKMNLHCPKPASALSAATKDR